MKKLNLSKRTIIIIRIIGLVSALFLIVFCVLYSSGWLPSYTEIGKDNINDYIGSDLWESVIKEFENIEIDSLPLKSQRDKISNYSATISLSITDKDEWIKNANDIKKYISEYLFRNTDCEINIYDSVSIKIRKDIDANCIVFSNIYDRAGKYRKYNSFDCLWVLSQNNSFFSFSDLPQLESPKYLIVDVPIDEETNLEYLSKIPSLEGVDLSVDKNINQIILKKLNDMNLSFCVNIY